MEYFKKSLINKIKNKTCKLGVVGLGYVGLPLAVEKARAGYEVIGFDIQNKKVEMVNKGENYIGDVIDDELKTYVSQGKLKASNDFSFIKEVDCVAICVPTPLDKYKQPDVSYVKKSTEDVANYLHKGMLIVLESTTYPGTTEEIVKPILETSGLKCGEEFFLAFSPERVDPGNKDYKTKNTPKVVGGCTSNCTEIAKTLYENILAGEIFTVSSPAVAEMGKILENTFRHINIGLVNEMTLLCKKMGIDVWEVIDAAKTKPFGFMAFYPGPGLGGHCIPLDPFYLTYKAREYDYHTRLIETAGEINDNMPLYVVENVISVLNSKKMALREANILLLGVAYKKDIDDIRESPALRILKELKKSGANVEYHDPHVPFFQYNGEGFVSIDIEEGLDYADIVVITTDHTAFDYDYITRRAKLIYDTRNATKNIIDNTKIYKL